MTFEVIYLARRRALCWSTAEFEMPLPEPGMSQEIDYYFSLPSPWAYIGHTLFRDLVSTYDLKVNHKPVFLGDLFSETGGLPLGKRHPVR